jgi:hypothetical protein
MTSVIQKKKDGLNLLAGLAAPAATDAVMAIPSPGDPIFAASYRQAGPRFNRMCQGEGLIAVANQSQVIDRFIRS